MKNNTLLTRRTKNVSLFLLFVVPALFIWLSVVILPFFYVIGITFTDWNGLSMNINFVGFKNYAEILTNTAFLQSLLKTIVYVIFSVILSNIIGFLLALAVTSGIKCQNVFRIGFFTPNKNGRASYRERV